MKTRALEVVLLVFDECDLLGAAAVLEVLSTAGRRYNFRAFRVTVVSEAGGQVATRAQAHLLADHSLRQAPVPEILVVPGGYGARRLCHNEQVMNWLSNQRGVPTCTLAIGDGLLPLAQAGYFPGVPKSDDMALDELIAALATLGFVNRGGRVSLSDSFGFARLSADAIDLSLELVKKTLGEKWARQSSYDLGYRWAPLGAERFGLGDPGLDTTD